MKPFNLRGDANNACEKESASCDPLEEPKTTADAFKEVDTRDGAAIAAARFAAGRVPRNDFSGQRGAARLAKINEIKGRS